MIANKIKLFLLIAAYNLGHAKKLKLRQAFLQVQSETDFWKCLRDFGIVKIENKWERSTHFIKNRWYNRKQKKSNGKEVQLRDELIKLYKTRNVLNDAKIKTFDQIYEITIRIVTKLRKSGIRGADQMTMYDLSFYIGSRRKINPQKVYIHRGVIDGAKSLKIIDDHKNHILNRAEVYKKCPLLILLGDSKHIENFLCINKNQLERINRPSP
jgi:hypothetical protein